MTTQIKALVLLALSAFLTGCITPPPPADGSVLIYKQPVSRIKERGTHVNFTVLATAIDTNLTYQWSRNGSNIVAATSRTYCIEGVQMSDVATYTCKVTGTNGTFVMSEPAHLSVFYTYCTNSVAGTLGVPILSFTSGGSITIDGKTFEQVSGNYGNFYGRNCTSQTGDYQNYAHTKLTIDTCHPDNNAVDTGIQVTKLLSLSKWSNDQAVPSCTTSQPHLSKTSLTLTATSKYKLSIYYDGPALSPTVQPDIKFNWHYHD